MNADFVTWLTTAIDSRGWNNSELARRAGMVPSTISMVISGHNLPSMEFCIKVAQALGESPEHVLRIAGHLPPLPAPVPNEQDAVHLFRQIPERYHDLVLRILTVFVDTASEGVLTEDDLRNMQPGDSIVLRRWTDHPLLRALDRFDWNEDQINRLIDLIASFSEQQERVSAVPAGGVKERKEGVPVTG